MTSDSTLPSKKYRFGSLGMLGQMYDETGEEVNLPDGTLFYLASDVDGPTSETRAFPQAPDTDERYNISDGLLETLIEVAQDNGFCDVVEALRELQARRARSSLKANDDYGCTGCRSTPCICAALTNGCLKCRALGFAYSGLGGLRPRQGDVMNTLSSDENPSPRQCTCVDADAITCYRMRYRTCEFSDSDDSFDGECECSCHAYDEQGNRLYSGDLL